MGGMLLGGRYRFVEPLAEGDNSSLWKAELFRGIGARTVAVRILHPDDPLARALVEGRALGLDIVHPCLLQPIELLADNGRLYLVSEWIEGERLADVADIHRRLHEPLPWRLVASIAFETLRALDALARRELVHGAVSPHNLILGEHGEVRLAGAGVALSEPRYLAPEVPAGEPVTVAADLYALARTLEEALDGSPGVPTRLTSVIERALEDRPERRHPSPIAMETELTGVLRDGGKTLDPRIVAASIARVRAAREVLPAEERPTLRFGELESLRGLR